MPANFGCLETLQDFDDAAAACGQVPLPSQPGSDLEWPCSLPSLDYRLFCLRLKNYIFTSLLSHVLLKQPSTSFVMEV